MIAVLRQRDFALLWSGQLISRIGDYVRLAALPFFVYDLTGSALATGTMFIVQVLPTLVAGSFMGVFVDRFDRKRAMILADVLRALLLLPLLVIRSADLVWIVYVVAFCMALVSLIFNPARKAMVPKLIETDHLTSANAADSMADSLSRLVGPALGGAALGLFGLPIVVLVDASSFLVSAVCIVSISASGRAVRAATGEAEGELSGAWSKMWRDWRAGLAMVKNKAFLRSLFVVLAIATLADSILTVLIVPFVKDFLGTGAEGFGLLLSARGLGGLIGAILVGGLARAVSSRHLVSWGLLGTGGILFAIVMTRSLTVALVLLVVAGLPTMAWMINTTTLLQKLTPDEYRGRIFGTYETTVALMMVIGMSWSGASADSLGTIPIMMGGACIYVLSGLLGLALLRPEPVIEGSSAPAEPQVPAAEAVGSEE